MLREPDETHRRGGKDRVDGLDAEIARLASCQHGVVATRQLRAFGASSRAIERRVAIGRLRRLHRGVHAVGGAKLDVRGRWMAAVLAGGPGAVLSHRPAGAAWNLRRWSGVAAITAPGWRRSADGIDVRSSPLPADERTTLGGIPVTTVPRTLLDLATVLSGDALVRALNEAEVRRLSDPLSLTALLERHRGERGAGALRRALADTGFGRGVAADGLEERFASFVRRHRLPPPLLNEPLEIDGHRHLADCLWPAARVIVELQSAAFHGSAGAMARDAERTRRLTLAGWTVVYVTWAQLGGRAADALAGDLGRLLRAARRGR